MNKFGKKLKKLREEHNLTTNEVAKRTLHENQDILSYEKGIQRPNVESIARFALLFKVDAQEWFLFMTKEDEERKKVKKIGKEMKIIALLMVAIFLLELLLWEIPVIPQELKLKVIYFQFYLGKPVLSTILGYLIMYRIQVSKAVKRTRNEVILVIYVGLIVILVCDLVSSYINFREINFLEIASRCTYNVKYFWGYVLFPVDFFGIIDGILICLTKPKHKTRKKNQKKNQK